MIRVPPSIASIVPILLLGACASAPDGLDWERTVVLSTGTKLGGCAVGDLDPDRPGLEIAAVAENGDVWIAWRDPDGGWRGEIAASVGGEMIQCAVGDADLDAPGLELVVVGMATGSEDSGGAGRAHVIRRSGAQWVAQRIFDDELLLHAVCVVDGEVFVAGFSQRAYRVVLGQNGWRSAPIASLPGAAKASLPACGGIAFACTDGSVVVARRDGAGWSNDVVNRRTAGRARLGTDGDRLLVADDDGELTLVDPGGQAQRVYKARQKLRGAVLADLDPAVPGLEAATVGYDRQVVLLRWLDGGWQSAVLSQESERLHHLACGELDPAPGLELVSAGYAGDLILYRRTR